MPSSYKVFYMISLLPHRAWILISGVDAEKFLQGQITVDVRQLAAGQSLLAAHCNPKGRIISLFRIMRYQDGFLLNLPADMLDIALSHFKKYSIFFKVTLNDVSQTLHAYGILHEPTLAGSRYAVGDTLGREYLITEENLSAITDQAWHIMDIQQVYPMVYAHSSEHYLPHFINLPLLGGVNFKKGCYTGQEIIARMEYRGQLKYHLVYEYLEQKPDDSVDACLAVDGHWHVLKIVNKEPA